MSPSTVRTDSPPDLAGQPVEHRRRRVDAPDRQPSRRECAREPSRPDAELEHRLAVGQALDEIESGPSVVREGVPGVVDVGESFAVSVDREVFDQFR